MTKLKPVLVFFLVFICVTVIVPSILVLPFTDKTSGILTERLERKESDENDLGETEEPAIEVAVYRVGQERIDKLSLEDYIVGVVAAEMPAEFELEALKAQALTARTYIVNQLLSEQKIGVPEGADVTDTENHQVFRSDEELRKQWGADYKWKIKKIKKAVKATAGQILTYNNEPIYAAFFSTSNGYTENSEDYWKSETPYLKSVESPWDRESPKFFSQKTLTVSEFESLLGVKLPQSGEIGTIIERTAGKRVGKVNINGKVFTGKEIRETLGLNSTDFSWERKGNKIVIQTKGYGHGVGMSQYGANGMASEGKGYKEIVAHYYKGAEISNSAEFLSKVIAQK